MAQTIEAKIGRFFRMSEDTWQRHAKPWSVWTRFSVLPLVIIAIWSRDWIGIWALVPLAISVVWTWLNPRIFPKPSRVDNWASKAVFGERIWLNRRAVAVPRHHRLMPTLLSIVSALGLPFLIWGLWGLSIWPTLVGTILVYAGKVWFLDRMVWLYEDTDASQSTTLERKL